MFKLLVKGDWRKETVERQRKVKHYYLIMVLTSRQRAAVRAKKTLANGDTRFKPRGEKNKSAFEALKQQAHLAQSNIRASNSESAESPLHKQIKITGAASSHTSVPARLLDLNPMNISDTSEEEEQADALSANIKTHREQIKQKEEHMKNELSKQ